MFVVAKIRVREKRKPKFYFIDSGIVRALKGQLGPVGVEEKGSLFEGFLAQLLRSYRDYFQLYDEHYYWSPAEAKQTEVDFLLKQGSDLIAIGAKSSTSIRKNDLKGLAAIKELSQVKRRIVVYLGDKKRYADGIDILPLKDFLKLLQDKTLIG